jgi:methylase of polypeptide subunit release factors
MSVGVLTSGSDVGTGTGIWAIDFADQYNNAEVTGTDLSPIQCTSNNAFLPNPVLYLLRIYVNLDYNLLIVN